MKRLWTWLGRAWICWSLKPSSLRYGLLVWLLLAGCPRLPPVSHCRPTEQRCARDSPEVCSATQRWEPASDTSCGFVGGICVVSDAGVARCVLVTDGGVP